jgi:putative CocE/NonD family hydrolase
MIPRIMLPTTANAAGAVDQRPAEARDDVLCFTSEVLTEPLEVTGHISLTLFASSSAADTDFTGTLVDVFPDGRAIFLTDGIMRAGTATRWLSPRRSRPASPASSAWTCRSRPTSSGPATGSGSRSPAATSRATTATPTRAA